MKDEDIQREIDSANGQDNPGAPRSGAPTFGKQVPGTLADINRKNADFYRPTPLIHRDTTGRVIDPRFNR